MTELVHFEKLEIEGFRGIIGKAEFDVDADVVLLLGGNGLGKSSLLQALTLLLTGKCGLPEAALPSVVDRVEKELSLQATARIAGVPNDVEKLEFSIKDLYRWNVDASPLPYIGNEPDKSTSDTDVQLWLANNRKLLSRLLSFAPEAVDVGFDELARGKTIREVLKPWPKVLDDICDALGKRNVPVRESLRRLSDAYRSFNDDQLRREASDFAEAFRAEWQPLRKRFEQLLMLIKPDAAFGSLGEARKLAAGLVEAHAAIDTFEDVIPKLMSEVEKGRVGHLDRAHFAQHSELGREKRRAELEVRRLVPLLAQFKSVEDGRFSISRLQALFEDLADGYEEWQAKLESLGGTFGSSFPTVASELGLVEPQRAKEHALRLGGWLQTHTEIQANIASLEALIAECERQMKQLDGESILVAWIADFAHLWEQMWPKLREARRRYSEALRKERQVDDARKLASEMESLLRDVDAAINELQGRNEDVAKDKLTEAFVKHANPLLERYAMVKGMLPLEPKPPTAQGDHAPISTKSGLGHSQLSTGQRAQVLVGFQVAQAELLRANRKTVQFPFRVMIFDDASTAYDLSNIAREAMLWRQLAYREKEEDRWQLFIASHHEEMSDRLLELLVPPAGRSMRVLKFVGWSPSTGPQIEAYSVKPSNDYSSSDQRGILAEALKRELWRV